MLIISEKIASTKQDSLQQHYIHGRMWVPAKRAQKRIIQNESDDFVVQSGWESSIYFPHSVRCCLIAFTYSLKGKQSPVSAVKAIWCTFGVLPADGDALLSVCFLVVKLPEEMPGSQLEGPADSLHFYLNI